MSVASAKAIASRDKTENEGVSRGGSMYYI